MNSASDWPRFLEEEGEGEVQLPRKEPELEQERLSGPPQLPPDREEAGGDVELRPQAWDQALE